MRNELVGKKGSASATPSPELLIHFGHYKFRAHAGRSALGRLECKADTATDLRHPDFVSSPECDFGLEVESDAVSSSGVSLIVHSMMIVLFNEGPELDTAGSTQNFRGKPRLERN